MINPIRQAKATENLVRKLALLSNQNELKLLSFFLCQQQNQKVITNNKS